MPEDNIANSNRETLRNVETELSLLRAGQQELAISLASITTKMDLSPDYGQRIRDVENEVNSLKQDRARVMPWNMKAVGAVAVLALITGIPTAIRSTENLLRDPTVQVVENAITGSPSTTPSPTTTP